MKPEDATMINGVKVRHAYVRPGGPIDLQVIINDAEIRANQGTPTMIHEHAAMDKCDENVGHRLIAPEEKSDDAEVA